MPQKIIWGHGRGQKYRTSTALLPLPPLKYSIGHISLLGYATFGNGSTGLGRMIYNIIIELNGSKISDDNESFWDTRNDSKNISGILLPKTSAQYEINSDALPKLFEKISEIGQARHIKKVTVTFLEAEKYAQ